MAAADHLQSRQLAMFMSPDEIIDTVHKGDSGLFSTRTPRQQWELPDPGYRDMSVRDMKLRRLRLENPKDFDKSHASTPPVDVQFQYTATSAHPEPVLVEGHHRLAFAEANRKPWLPVKYHK